MRGGCHGNPHVMGGGSTVRDNTVCTVNKQKYITEARIEYIQKKCVVKIETSIRRGKK